MSAGEILYAALFLRGGEMRSSLPDLGEVRVLGLVGKLEGPLLQGRPEQFMQYQNYILQRRNFLRVAL
jgi:hypothetical protein